MSLVRQFGPGEFQNAFSRAFVEWKGKLLLLLETDTSSGHPDYDPDEDDEDLPREVLDDMEGYIRLREIVRTEGSKHPEFGGSVSIDIDEVDSLDFFAYPELGWRQSADGLYLAYFYRLPGTYQRGLKVRNMEITPYPSTYLAQELGLIGFDYLEPSEATIAEWAMRPVYTDLTTAISEMLSGKRLHAAVSPHLALAPHSGDQPIAVLYRRNVVGYIDNDGAMTFTTGADIGLRDMLFSLNQAA